MSQASSFSDRRRVLIIAALAAVEGIGRARKVCAAEPPGEETVVPAAVARQKRGQSCVVEMVVQSSKHEQDRHIYYLDSEVDYRDAKNVAVVIGEKDLDKFRKAGIEDPSKFYFRKRIRVAGTIVFEDDQYQIHVKDPDRIKVLAPSGADRRSAQP